MTIRVLSWNLFGLNDDELDVRTEAAMFISLLGGSLEQVLAEPAAEAPPETPHVLMFQEVVDRSLVAHLRPHLEAAGYTLFPREPRHREYYEVVAIRPPFTSKEARIVGLDSAQGRELVVVDAELEGQTWRFITGHLESMKAGAHLRHQQSLAVLSLLREHPGPAVFGGDTNLRVAEALALGPLLDGWEASGGVPAERWTRVSPRTGVSTQYDRFWGNKVTFSKFHNIGRDPVTPTGEPPSDHFGIVVNVSPS